MIADSRHIIMEELNKLQLQIDGLQEAVLQTYLHPMQCANCGYVCRGEEIETVCVDSGKRRDVRDSEQPQYEQVCSDCDAYGTFVEVK